MLAYQAPSPLRTTPLRRRASGLGLAIAINLALLLVLLRIGGVLQQPPKLGEGPLVVELTRDSENAAPAASPVPERKAETKTTRSETKPLPKPRIELPAKPTIEAPSSESPWLELSKEEMAAADIGKMQVAGGSGSGRGDSEEVGRGPNGEVLYAAEWARRPTNAELRGYLPLKMVDGWGLIACRTAEGNRVEDCIELGQSPRGSRLASAVRQAAWQFRVKPPRKNGKPLIGSWVQIRIDYVSVRT